MIPMNTHTNTLTNTFIIILDKCQTAVELLLPLSVMYFLYSAFFVSIFFLSNLYVLVFSPCATDTTVRMSM